ncbi:MAG TPA: PAS domain S-box protein [Candidatus Limnocylindrales bacterium]|nr:PAS domain S-box protein [Candidatus Limnocylindrales bacterium]
MHHRPSLPPDALALQHFRRLQRALSINAAAIALAVGAVYAMQPSFRVAAAAAAALWVALAAWLIGRLARSDLPTAALLMVATMLGGAVAAVVIHPALGQASAVAALTGAAVAIAFLDGRRLRASLALASIVAAGTTLISLTTPASPDIPAAAAQAMSGFAVVAGVVGFTVVLLEWRRRLEGAAERYRRLYDGVPVGLVRSTPDGRLLEANPAMAAIFGYTDGAALRAIGADALFEDPAERARVLGSLGDADGPLEREFRIRRADGSGGWARITGRTVRDAHGQVAYLEAAVRDVTEAKEDALALAESQAALRLILDQLPAVLWTASRDLRLETVDGAPLVALGLRADGLIGRSVAEIAGQSDRAAAALAAHRQALAGSSASFEIRWNGLDLQAHLEPLRDAGEVIGVIGIALDVTDQARLEAQLRQAHKMEAVGRLAGGIAHDFNNLLTAILGNAALALSELPAGHASRSEVEQIRAAAERAAALTGQLLAFGRRQLTRPRSIDLQSVVDGLEPLLRRLLGEHIRIVFDRAAMPPAVLGDASQLEQVILNLALNGRDAMPAGGELTISTGVTDLDASFVWEHPGAHLGRHARLSVSDTGTGIDAAIREHLFEPFFSTKDVGQGTGLGLATVYGIVKQSHGYIDVRSVPGEGSTFDIYLPLSRDRALGPPTARPGEPASAGALGAVLLVEDEILVRRLAERVLRAEGYDVTVAGNGSEALAQATGLEQVDILVTDIVMPGMSGLELADRLGPDHPRLKVLYMTGYPGDEGDGLVAGRPVLSKPFTPEALLAAVRTAAGAGPRRLGPAES